MIFLTLLILDFGAHWLQFLSSSLTKSHHKGKNRKENFIVAFYYKTGWFFTTICLGGEFGGCSLYLLTNDQRWFENKAFMALSYFLLLCLAFKNFINIFQWTGAAERNHEYDEA